MKRINFVNFGYVQTYKATTNCHSIKRLAQAIHYHGVAPLRDDPRNNGILHRDSPPEGSVVVYYDGACYIINDDLRAIAPDGVFQGNKERQVQLKDYLMANFPNFPLD